MSKIFPFTGGGGGSLNKNFFSQSKHVSSQIWCQNFFPLLGGGGPSTKLFFASLNMYQAKSGVKNFSLYWDWGPPPKGPEIGYPSPHLDLGPPLPGPGTPLDLDLGPPHLDLDLGPPPPRPGPGTPPTWTWTWDPPTWTWTWDPPPRKSEQTDNSKYKYYLPSYYVRGR